MDINYNQKALEDLAYWKESGNTKIQKKISQLIEAIEINPFKGIGKPKHLNFSLLENGQEE
jgi:toxin YoeB